MAKSDHRKERKTRVRQWQDAERAAFISHMPMSPSHLELLLEQLGTHLKSCDHTLTNTESFLLAHQLDRTSIVSWLAEQGGYCDCEVLYNLEDVAESLRDRPIPPRAKPKPQKNQPRTLTTATGWDLANLPAPWRIANLYVPDEPLQFQIGKKGGCTVTLVESPLPKGDQTSDDYWSKLWYARTELPKKSSLRVNRGRISLPPQLQSVVAESANWTPVYGWIYREDQTWYLEVHTESNRLQGDLTHVSQLIAHLEKIET